MRKILAVMIFGFLLLPANMTSAADSDNSGSSSNSDSISNSSSESESETETETESEQEDSGDDTMRISNTHNSGFEGIWNLDGLGTNWVGVTVSGGKIILLKYQPGQLSSALAGSVVGSTASLGFATDASSFAATLTLTSSTTATLAVTSCTPKPGLTCSFPGGSNFTITKVFE